MPDVQSATRTMSRMIRDMVMARLWPETRPLRNQASHLAGGRQGRARAFVRPAGGSIGALSAHCRPVADADTLRAMDLDQLEAFALAENREAALAQLVPGTKEYYYFHCLHYQHTGDLAKSYQFLERWIERHGRSSAARAISHRQALLSWGHDPRGCVDYLRQVLGLRFDHARELAAEKRALPTQVDPQRLARAELMQQALDEHRDLAGFTDAALDWLMAEWPSLDPQRRRQLLARLQRPDHPGAVDLVLADLAYPRSEGFGSLPIHGRLLLAQLDELVQRQPALRDTPEFVHVYLERLSPGPAEDIARDHAARRRHVERLWSFVSGLAPVFASLHAHVLYHWLALDRGQGRHDRERFLAYLRLPRKARYVPEAHLAGQAERLADLGQRFPTGLEPVGDDEALVRDYLAHFLVDAESHEEFSAYVRDDVLRTIFATAKILAGQGDGERWYALLDDPAHYQALKDRVDIDFAPTNQSWFGAGEPVALELDLKNVPTLVIKIYEIDTLGYYTREDREIDTSIDLDGLPASQEQVHTYEELPLLRRRRRFAFDELARPGIYVIDFIGNGKSSRALVRKGRLGYVERHGAAGHVLTVLDEDGRALRDASVWLGGREYGAREDGTIAIPYSTRPGRRSLLLRHGDLTVRETLNHLAESYDFSAGFFVEREALVPGNSADVLVRPRLSMHGSPVSLSLLAAPVLVVTTTDRHGVRASQQVADFALPEDREPTHRFRVPPDLAEVTFELRARVRSVTEQRDIDLAAEMRYEVNGWERTHATEGLHLGRAAAGYTLDLLGKSGEPRPGVAIQLSLQHRDFTRPVIIDVETDARGQVSLGPLPDVVSITAQRTTGVDAAGAAPGQWPLARDAASCPRAIHALAGEDIAIPYMGTADDRISLLERCGSGYRADWARACEIENGYLCIHGLPAGDYELGLVRPGVHVDIRVAARPPRGARPATAGDAQPAGGGEAAPAWPAWWPPGWIVDGTRLLPRTPLTGLQITQVVAREDAPEGIVIRLAGVTERTRVHVFGVRFVSRFDLAQRLAPAPRPVAGAVARARSATHYVSGRRLGDEYRYVLERKQAGAFPGVMLERPRLLLNPWAVRKTETSEEHAREGGAYAAVGAPPPPPRPAPMRDPRMARPDGVDAASVDFVAAPAAAWLNLRPDHVSESTREGVVRIERAGLGRAQVVRVLAVDDSGFAYRELGLPAHAGGYRDLRLSPGLDPQAHLAEKHRVSVLGAGASLAITNRAHARWEIYDTLGKVFDLFAALSDDRTLGEFRFVLDWPRLSGDEKRERYGKYACHELHLFLSRKDPGFFAEVVQPYLRNKKEKTFLDHYLLGDDLGRYRELWAHGRLNTLERILLSQRAPGEAEIERQRIEHRCERLPRDPARDERLFRTALQRGALDTPPPTSGAPPMAGAPGGGGPMQPGLAQDTGAVMSTITPMAKAKKAVSRSRSYAPQAAAQRASMDDVSFGVAELASMAPEELAEAMLDLEAADRDSDVGERAQVRRLYRAADKTEEWAENNYYRLRRSEQGPELIPVNAFWRDFARHGGAPALDGAPPFASPHVAHATSCFAEMMCALAVLDLPFAAGGHEVREQGHDLLVRTSQPAIVFHEELAAVAAPAADAPVQVQQHYLRMDDRFRYEDGEQRARYVTGALLTRTVYVCEIVLGNVTSAPLDLVLLWQVPAGAVPVGDGFATRSQRLRLGPYQTTSLEYAFYFPAAGNHAHFPVHVARGEALVAAAPPRVLVVADAVDEPDRSSWAHVSQHGTSAEVLAFLAAHDLERLELARIAWRMEDRGFYEAVIAHLDARHVHDRTLWSYALAHRDLPRVNAFLRHEESFLRECGAALRSSMVEVDPVARGWHEHLEYAPLIHARAHALGGERKILDQALAAQYRRFLDVLACQPALSEEDVLAAAYYLLLQDRVAEGLTVFDRVDEEAVVTRLQYDYMAAVGALYRGQAQAARQVALIHAEHPVDRWRKRFAAVVSVVDEAGGGGAAAARPEGQGVADEGAWLAEQAHLAETEQGFDIAVEGGAVVLSYQNLAQVEVRYYLMDIELAFSRAPFVSQATERFALVKPHGVDVVALPAAARQHRFALPPAYARRNVVVEVVAAGMRKAQGHYAHELLVHVAAQYGQVRVYEQAGGGALPRSYVKVYARMRDGEVRFYKDGYTDLRGCFDYASLSTDALDRVERFAMLVVSQEHGAMIREAAPPQQ
jgi:hypothetical protein